MSGAATLRDRERAAPVWLVEIRLKGGGPTLYLSDRNIEMDGQRYEDYIEDIAESASVVFKNDPFMGYGRLVEATEEYPVEGAAITVSETYMDDDGRASGKETVFEGFLGSPVGIDLFKFRCPVVHAGTKADNL